MKSFIVSINWNILLKLNLLALYACYVEAFLELTNKNWHFGHDIIDWTLLVEYQIMLCICEILNLQEWNILSIGWPTDVQLGHEMERANTFQAVQRP